MKHIWIIILVLLISMSSTNLIGQTSEWNLDFEQWDLSDKTYDLWHDTTIVENRVAIFPPNWHFRPDHIPESNGLAQTTDATNGNYAVALSGYYQYEVMRIISGKDAAKPGWSIDFRPTEFSGDYKAILLGSCDSLRTYVDLYLTKYDINKNQRDTIGQANLVLNESNIYKQFNLQINYKDESIIPDTVIIVLAKERFGFDVPPACLECSHVFFDNLKLIEDASTDITNQNISSIEIYPNPAMDYIIIKSGCEDCLYDVTFTSLGGKLAKKYYSIKDVIDLQNSELGNGVFFVRIVETLSGKNFYKKITLD